jgi:hypothetical protein
LEQPETVGGVTMTDTANTGKGQRCAMKNTLSLIAQELRRLKPEQLTQLCAMLGYRPASKPRQPKRKPTVDMIEQVRLGREQGLSYKEIGKLLDRDETWVRNVIYTYKLAQGSPASIRAIKAVMARQAQVMHSGYENKSTSKED